jgi:hypothetical protein
MDRKSLLFNSFMQDLGGAAHDAQMAYHSCTKDYLHARSKESVAQFLRSYLKYRSSTPWSSPHGMSSDGTTSDNRRPSTIFTLDDVHSMIKFHNSVVEPLARHFANWALQNFSEFPGTHACFDPLTHTEQSHIFRALYRFQICANLFGFRRGIDGEWGDSPDFNGIYILISLETMFEPWEIEELTYITLVSESRYKEIFRSVRSGLDKDSPGTSDPTHHMTHLTTKTTVCMTPLLCIPS